MRLVDRRSPRASAVEELGAEPTNEDLLQDERLLKYGGEALLKEALELPSVGAFGDWMVSDEDEEQLVLPDSLSGIEWGVAAMLSDGFIAADIALMLDISAGRVSQIRKELAKHLDVSGSIV